ncbi:glycosyltransferase family 9 protein [Salidesulfovibrio onnuriiensis]|uniref:glycosyltransferase family 9 protein n=1 Tax=Salidesulfovibrio onnuriiensis TaxID=2583823 RepID=UPI0011C9827A|nr:glycosyltransferase family 9 protein [Salidesulfovibrio onnuriiensis]
MNTDPQKILIVRIDRIGDMFTTTPAIRALREQFPNARIDMAASQGNHTVVHNNPHLDHVYVFHPNKIWSWPMALLKLWATRYDWVISLNAQSSTAAFLARCTGAPMRASYDVKKTKQSYTFTIPDISNEHMVHKQLRLTEALGAPSTDTSQVFPVAESLAAEARKRFPRQDGLRRIGMFIGNAKKVQTRWPAEKFRELATRLLDERKVEVYVIGGPGDAELFEGFAWSARCIRYPGGSLEQLGAFMKTCDLMVTSSTGPMHLAAAVDAPMVAILAEHTYQNWRPLADMHTNLNSGDPGVDVRDMPVETVLDAVLKKLDEMGKD